MPPSFSRVWKEIGVAKWAWDTRSILMIPSQRPSLVMVRNATGHPVRSDPGLVITRIDKDGVAAALDKYLSGIGVTGHAPEGPRGGVVGRHHEGDGGRRGAAVRVGEEALGRPGSTPARSSSRWP